jgi:hypothetical protein
MPDFPPLDSSQPPGPLEVPPLGEGLTEAAHWVTEGSEDPTFPEGAWSEHTAQIEAVTEPGYRYEVKYQATYWRAVPAQPEMLFEVAESVSVVGRRGNELIICPMPRPHPAL